jgi:UDP-glucuronate 4-epimerase
MSRNVLVTGGAGFIGSHITESLLRRGERVVVLDDFNDFYDPVIKRQNATRIEAVGATICELDFCDAEQVEQLFDSLKPDAVIHLGAYAGVIPSRKDPRRYMHNNVVGTTVLLETSVRHGVRDFLLASSSSVYGNNEKIPFAEDDRVDEPISPYAASKKACELVAHTYAHLYDLPIRVLRFFTAYGPRQRPDLAIHIFMRRIAAGEPITVYGDGSMSRDFTYIADIAYGVLAALDVGAAHGKYRIYNLGGSAPVRLDELIEAIETTIGRKAIIEHQPHRPGDVERTYADLTRSSVELGYRPQVELAQGLAEQWAWMQEAGIVDSGG